MNFSGMACRRLGGPEYARLLHERYGIEFRAVAGCIIS
jgi:hypothetical protein